MVVKKVEPEIKIDLKRFKFVFKLKKMTRIGNLYTFDKKACKYCGSEIVVKSGVLRNKQRYKCTQCNRHFQENTKRRIADENTRKQIISLYILGTPIRIIAKFLSVSHTWVIKWLKQYASQLKHYVPNKAEDIEIDEMYLYIKSKKRKRWLWTAVCRETKRILGFQVGQRNRNTVKKLYHKIEPVQCETYHTDSYKGYLTVFPAKKHSRKFRGTNTIEGLHSAYRHYLSRFRRRSKCYSKSEKMVVISMQLLQEKYDKEYNERIELHMAA